MCVLIQLSSVCLCLYAYTYLLACDYICVLIQLSNFILGVTRAGAQLESSCTKKNQSDAPSVAPPLPTTCFSLFFSQVGLSVTLPDLESQAQKDLVTGDACM